MRPWVIAAGMSLRLAATPARGDDDVPRYQVVGADVAADATVAVGLHLESPGTFGIGVAAYVLAAPLVHLGHGDLADGAISAGLRVGMPLGGAFALGMIGVIGGGAHTGALASGARGAIVGAVLGALGAEVLDAAWLAGPADRSATTRMVRIGGRF